LQKNWISTTCRQKPENVNRVIWSHQALTHLLLMTASQCSWWWLHRGLCYFVGLHSVGFFKTLSADSIKVLEKEESDYRTTSFVNRYCVSSMFCVIHENDELQVCCIM
jgi:hypothetical protein